MLDTRDEPTVPIGRHRGGGDPAAPAAPAGAHRLPAGDTAHEPWPRWLLVLAVLAMFVAGAIAWLLVAIPGADSGSRQGAPAGPVSVPDKTFGTQPALTGGTAATMMAESSPPPSSPATSPEPSPTPARSAPSPARSAVALVRVPGVVGRPQPAATAALRGAGFAVAVVDVSKGARKGAKHVVSQSPASGQAVTSGSTVTIYVGNGSGG